MAVLYAITGSTMNWAASTWGLDVAGGVWDDTARTLTKAGAFAGVTGTPVVDIGGTLFTVATVTSNDVLTMTATPSKTNGTYTFAIFNQAQPAANDIVHCNGCEITANENANIPTAYTIGVLGTNQLTSIDSLNIAGTATNGHVDINMTTVGAAKGIGVVNIAGGAVPFIVTTGATNLLTIDCTGGTCTGGTATNAWGIGTSSTHPFTFHGSASAGTAVFSSGIVKGNTGATTLNVVNSTGKNYNNAAGIYDNADAAFTIELSGVATGGVGLNASGIVGSYGQCTVNGGSAVDSTKSSGLNGVKWNPTTASYYQTSGTGSPKLRLESAVVAAAKVLSGEPRWTGATGADIGTLPYTRKRGALR